MQLAPVGLIQLVPVTVHINSVIIQNGVFQAVETDVKAGGVIYANAVIICSFAVFVAGALPTAAVNSELICFKAMILI